MHLNTRLFFSINHLSGRSRFLDAFAQAGAEWVLPIMIGWFAVADFTYYDRNLPALVLSIVTLGFLAIFGLALSYGVAALVREPRPYVRHGEMVKTLFRPLFSWKSFPSDHSLGVFLIVGVAYCFGLPWLLPLIIMALWVCFSRIYAGVHYPADILGGFVLGAVVLLGYGLIFLEPIQRIVNSFFGV